MKIFDFNKAKQFHHQEVVDFWNYYHKKAIGIDFYVIALKKVRKNFPESKNHRSPSRLKKEYKHLKEEFGFFK